MKKNHVFGHYASNVWMKTLKVMKLTVFLFLLGIFSVSAKGFGQGGTISLKMEHVSLEDILQELKAHSDYTFVYSDHQIENVKVDLFEVKDANLEVVMDECLQGADLEFYVENDVVVIRKKTSVVIEEVKQEKKTITGTVLDDNGEPLPGATLIIKGTTKGVITGIKGDYSFNNVPNNAILECSFIGFTTQTQSVESRRIIDWQLKSNINELDNVTVVAFGKQKKESVLSSIQTVKIAELRTPSSNLTTALAGRVSGLISYQTTGEPGEDNAIFFIRGVSSFGTGKVNPLILIDNVEVSSSDLSRLHPDDIQSFSILKDATATSLYGARGANGVILVQTKEGKVGKAKISFRFEVSLSSPTQEIEMADPITYMRMGNEAIRTRNPLGEIPYSNDKIEYTQKNLNSYAYPAVDWMDLMFKDIAINKKANMNVSGGGKVARYYIAASVSQDKGILNTENIGGIDNNISLTKYLIRSNININLSKTTKVAVRVHGTFDDYNGPLTGGSTMYKAALNVNPVAFTPTIAPDENFKLLEHTLFGNHLSGDYLNPYAEMVKGYKEKSTTVMLAQFEIDQDLSRVTDGLKARLLFNTKRDSYYDLSRNYDPFYYAISSYDRLSNVYQLSELNPELGTEYLSYNEGSKRISNVMYLETSVSYNKTVKEDHTVSGMLVFIARNKINGNAGSLINSLPARNLGLSGRATYEYKSKYLLEANFGYNGSEKFDKGHRWGFFPSVGAGWILSNENWWNGNLLSKVSKFKLKATYGLVGNDQIGNSRFFYLSNVQIKQGGSYKFGEEFNGIKGKGVKIKNYANSNIGWEIAYKTNLGFELGLFDDKIEIQADLFHELRTNILQNRSDIAASMGLWKTPKANVGEAKSKGFDLSVDCNHSFNKDFWITARGNFTYARGEYSKYEESNYDATPWKSRVGHSIKQRWGYVAERLFIDQLDIENSPRQDLGLYEPGDIKYTDLNKDGIINELDQAPIGKPTVPEINYGFGVSTGYKGFDFSFFFQGSARSSFWINPTRMTPFRKFNADSDNNFKSFGKRKMETGLAQFIADNYWSEGSQNPEALWPRLSTTKVDNNLKTSTYYMRDGSFLRLKSVEFGYNIPSRLLKCYKISNLRCYLNASNLMRFSKFKEWDVEMGGNGLGYPLQRKINIGVSITF